MGTQPGFVLREKKAVCNKAELLIITCQSGLAISKAALMHYLTATAPLFSTTRTQTDLLNAIIVWFDPLSSLIFPLIVKLVIDR